MRISVDTNILVRAVVRDNAEQARTAIRTLKGASVIVVVTPCLCEFVWVLRRVYRMKTAEIGAAIRALAATGNVEMNRPAVEAGLAMLEEGGDFADGVIAYEGAWMGGETFVSFDKTAIGLLAARGHKTRLL